MLWKSGLHVIATLDVNSTVAYLVDIVVASPYTGLVVAQFAGYHGGPAIIVAVCIIIIVAAATLTQPPSTAGVFVPSCSQHYSKM